MICVAGIPTVAVVAAAAAAVAVDVADLTEVGAPIAAAVFGKLFWCPPVLGGHCFYPSFPTIGCFVQWFHVTLVGPNRLVSEYMTR